MEYAIQYYIKIVTSHAAMFTEMRCSECKYIHTLWKLLVIQNTSSVKLRFCPIYDENMRKYN